MSDGPKDKQAKPKSHSQRLRAIMFRVWEIKNEGFADFESYYKNKMAWIIQEWQRKLPNP